MRQHSSLTSFSCFVLLIALLPLAGGREEGLERDSRVKYSGSLEILHPLDGQSLCYDEELEIVAVFHRLSNPQ